MTKRNLFAEISEGFEALADERASKETLSTNELENWEQGRATYNSTIKRPNPIL